MKVLLKYFLLLSFIPFALYRCSGCEEPGEPPCTLCEACIDYKEGTGKSAKGYYLIVDTKTNKILKKIDLSSIGVPGRQKWVQDIKQGQAVIIERGKPETFYIYNLESDSVRATITNSVFGLTTLTPDARTMIMEEIQTWQFHTGRIKVFDLENGKELTKLEVSLPEKQEEGKKIARGGIIYLLPDSSGFIYNTTEELLTVDLATGQVTKRVKIQYPEGVVK